MVRDDFEHALLEGLARSQKAIPSRFFYDATGSRLFEEITRQPEYYQTRAEIALLGAHQHELRSLLRNRVLIELGSGSSRKTELLLEASQPAAYVAIDVSASALQEAMARLAARWPTLPLLPVVADFTAPLCLPQTTAHLPRLGFFPGSTIGNLTTDEASALLGKLKQTLAGGQLLLGADWPNAPHVMRAAYDDGAGVTARFNLNLLVRANRELGADFNLAHWAHEATWDGEAEKIDMWLVSRRAQRVEISRRTFSFSAGERIHTELSQKYRQETLARVAKRAGLSMQQAWVSNSHSSRDVTMARYGLYLLE